MSVEQTPVSKNTAPKYDLYDIANAIGILMTSDNTPQSIHDSIADTLTDLEDAWTRKNINQYDPAHLEEVLELELDSERGETNQTTAAENASDAEEKKADEEEDAGEPEREGITGEELDVFAHVLSKILKGGYVSKDAQTHFCDAITQIDEDWRNATDDYESEDYIRKVVRGYFGEDVEKTAAA